MTLASGNKKKEYQVIDIKLNMDLNPIYFRDYITLYRSGAKLVTSNIVSFGAKNYAWT